MKHQLFLSYQDECLLFNKISAKAQKLIIFPRKCQAINEMASGIPLSFDILPIQQLITLSSMNKDQRDTINSYPSFFQQKIYAIFI